MSSQSSQSPKTSPLSAWRASVRKPLTGRRTLLLAAVLVLVGFAVSGRLDMTEALLGSLVLLVVALLTPRRRGSRALAEAGPLRNAAGPDGTVRLFADTLPDPCIVIDRRSVVVHRNGPAAILFPAVRAGDPVFFSLRQPALLAAIESARQSRERQIVELHQAVPTEAWYKVTVTPLAATEGAKPTEAAPIVILLQNLTEARRVEAMRADFIANASHELRTPLASLIGFVDTLLGPAARDAEARRKFLEIMRAQAARMSKLVDDLLSLSRIEMHQHVPPTGKVNLALLLGEVVEGLQTQAKEAGVAVKLEGATGDTRVTGDARVTGDRDELYEVFENLLDNAIKYGEAGGTVEVTLELVNREGFAYLVRVTDHGQGVAPEHVPRLTERFYRIDADSSRKKKGTGLGLAIVKHIVARHRGELAIRSRPGEGTTVEVTLRP